MQQSFPFQPRGANQNPPVAQSALAVTTAVQQVSLPGVSPNGSETTMRIVVDGSSNIAWAYGAQAGLTYANGNAMLGNTVETFNVPNGVTQLSVIGAASGSTIRIHIGDGI
jgi:hypothetical protein